MFISGAMLALLSRDILRGLARIVAPALMAMANVFTPTVNSVVTPTTKAIARHDPWTVAATAVIVFSLASVLHEAIGHGGACLMVHGAPLELSSMHLECDMPNATRMADRLVAAAGTVATLVGGLAAYALYQLHKGPNGLRYALWLFAAVALMEGSGYLLFAGLANRGDWSNVFFGMESTWLWRLPFIVMGFTLYVFTTKLLFREIDPLVGEARPRRYENGLRLSLRPYVVGAVLALMAGLLNPGGLEVVLFSDVAASLGGTTGLLWGAQVLRGTRTPSALLEKPVALVKRSWITITFAVFIGLGYIIGLGPGVPLR